jgi:hypothetical protein
VVDDSSTLLLPTAGLSGLNDQLSRAAERDL